MSCFVVSNATIDVIVNAAAARGLLGQTPPRAVGQLLLDDNRESYAYRYSQYMEEEKDAEWMTAPYVLVTTEAPLHPHAVIKAIQCYRYQSCEHPGWAESFGQVFTEALQEAIEAELPASDMERVPQYGRLTPRYRTGRVYDQAPWDNQHVEDAAAMHWANTLGAGAR